MTNVNHTVSYRAEAAVGLLQVEQLTCPEQITSQIALNAAKLLAANYAASPGFNVVVKPWLIRDHFIPGDYEDRVMPGVVSRRRELMQANMAKMSHTGLLVRMQHVTMTP